MAMAMSASIRAFARVRPLLAFENGDKQHTTELLRIKDRCISTKSTFGSIMKEFEFDGVLEERSSQADVFAVVGVEEMIENVIGGYNGTIFAYGQTGSGKTFTVDGYSHDDDSVGLAVTPEEHLGILPRAIRLIFSKAEKARSEGAQLSISISCYQIYQEQIYDLCNPAHFSADAQQRHTGHVFPGLRVRYSADKHFYIENLFKKSCFSSQEATRIVLQCLKYRKVTSHALNMHSSRSHCVYSISVDRIDEKTETHTISSLTVVDLAGSERTTWSKAEGKVLEESIAINQSLFALRKVILALSEQQKSKSRLDAAQHIPYRDSRLTQLLQHSLGGSSFTVMIACISPSDVYHEETMSTLHYASMVMSIVNLPAVNETPSAALVRELQREIASLKEQLLVAHNFSAIAPSNCPHCKRALRPSDICATVEPSSPIVVADDDGPSKTGATESLQISKLKAQVISSVTFVKKLVQNNTSLRSTAEENARKARRLDHEMRNLLMENVSLRDRIESLSTLSAPPKTVNPPKAVRFSSTFSTGMTPPRQQQKSVNPPPVAKRQHSEEKKERMESLTAKLARMVGVNDSAMKDAATLRRRQLGPARAKRERIWDKPEKDAGSVSFHRQRREGSKSAPGGSPLWLDAPTPSAELAAHKSGHLSLDSLRSLLMGGAKEKRKPKPVEAPVEDAPTAPKNDEEKLAMILEGQYSSLQHFSSKMITRPRLVGSVLHGASLSGATQHERSEHQHMHRFLDGYQQRFEYQVDKAGEKT